MLASGGTINATGRYQSCPPTSGDRYLGEFRDNKRNGQGTLPPPSGERCFGALRGNPPDVRGLVYSSNQ
jgi:hypothetical protein